MRLVVIGEVHPQPDTTLKGVAWFRYPVPKARQPLYAKLQATYQPQAPGDYEGDELAEVGQLQRGEYVEHAVGADARFDPAAGVATMQAQIARLYELAVKQFAFEEDARLQFFGSSFDGAGWEMRSA